MGRSTALSAVDASHGWVITRLLRTDQWNKQDSHYFEWVLTGDSVYGAALAASFVVVTIASPAGVSGAVLLVPFQVGVLGTPSLAATPTNLLYNVVATPGALYRCWRQGQTVGA
jgi:hypothetical protein